MTDDIVTRLNSSHAFLGDPLHKEAADEIERLRAALKEIAAQEWQFAYAPVQRMARVACAALEGEKNND